MAEAAEKAKAKTVYVVLKKTSDCWQIDGPNQPAHNAEQAKRQAAELRVEAKTDPNGIYVAVPVKSWNPTPITAELQTVLKLGGSS